jgi:hypothetical protein
MAFFLFIGLIDAGATSGVEDHKLDVIHTGRRLPLTAARTAESVPPSRVTRHLELSAARPP